MFSYLYFKTEGPFVLINLSLSPPTDKQTLQQTDTHYIHNLICDTYIIDRHTPNTTCNVYMI